MPAGDSLCATLGIVHPLTRTTCIGYGTRKPDCGCAVALASRQAANALLLEIKDDLDQQLDVTDSLSQLASLLLCKRWHQYQADENVNKWKKSLRSYASSSRENGGSSTPSRSSWPPSQLQKKEVLRSTSSRRLLKELRRRIEDLGDSDLFTEVIKLADELRTLQSDSDEEEDDSEDDRPNTQLRTLSLAPKRK
ncbi:hypothetical protein H2198_009024 [Neophaeococcomyces mojaviensis]|uniref:Uncharacterized protein n=1 Tax=Neophaeococcomyces mojaviensis TaxID=3383035 RepID=A0ACC2ZVL4_9EURO|nr:hypothetical protein H2198_009024 [Knufia sp. JES_112]